MNIALFYSFNMARICQTMGLKVIAGCLSLDSAGAQSLQEHNNGYPDICVQELDITRPDSIGNLRKSLEDHLASAPHNEFYALVNNAGCMSFGEFEWLTPAIIRQHIEVNLLGTMNVTHSLLPILRRQSSERNLSGRIINVTSHCGLFALPGLSAYAASKAGLLFWTNALRVEMGKYGVQVVNFIPGSFVLQSNILGRQAAIGDELWQNMDQEQKGFYRDYFSSYNNYLVAYANLAPKGAVLVDPRIVRAFQNAISSRSPKRRYLVEPWRYKYYHTMFKILPESKMRDDLIEKFMGLPRFQKPQGNIQ